MQNTLCANITQSNKGRKYFVQTIMQIINKGREYFVQTLMQIIKKGREYFSPETDHPVQCARAYHPVLLLVHVLE